MGRRIAAKCPAVQPAERNIRLSYATRLYGIHRSTLYRYFEKGLASVLINSNRYVNTRDLEKFIREYHCPKKNDIDVAAVDLERGDDETDEAV